MTIVERTTRQVVVVVPAHNEVANLPGCIASVRGAAAAVPVPVLTVVVLDHCDDGSEDLSVGDRADVHFHQIDARNVGTARAAGFEVARRMLDTGPQRTWYATTDADTRVDPDWLQRQLASQADMVLGLVRVPAGRVPPGLARRYLRGVDADDHAHVHVHGANLGCRAARYWEVGGFAHLATGEDVDLVTRFEAAGYTIDRDPDLWVTTSARRTGRAPGGFAEDLRAAADLPAVEDAS